MDRKHDIGPASRSETIENRYKIYICLSNQSMNCQTGLCQSNQCGAEMCKMLACNWFCSKLLSLTSAHSVVYTFCMSGKEVDSLGEENCENFWNSLYHWILNKLIHNILLFWIDYYTPSNLRITEQHCTSYQHLNPSCHSTYSITEQHQFAIIQRYKYKYQNTANIEDSQE